MARTDPLASDTPAFADAVAVGGPLVLLAVPIAAAVGLVLRAGRVLAGR